MDYDLLIRNGRVVDGSRLPSFIADVTIFDPKTIKACAPEYAADYPPATKPLIQRSEGVCQTIVSGKVVYEDGKLSGEMAGKVLRGTEYQAQW